MKKNKILLLIVLLLPLASFAMGVFDHVVNDFYVIAASWLKKLLPIAKGIFWLTSLLEFLWMVGVKKMLAGQADKILYIAIYRAIVAGLLFSLFVDNVDFYIGIIKWILNIGNVLGGAISGQPSGTIYSVSDLFDQIWNAVKVPFSILIVTSFAAGVVSTSLGTFLFFVVGGIIVVVLGCCVTVMWLLARAWIVLFGGFFLTGFIGSNWTRNYWQKYLSFVVGVGFSLFGLSLVLVMVTAQWSHPGTWLPELPNVSPTNPLGAVQLLLVIGDLINHLIAMLGVLFFDLVLIIGAPMIGSSLASGTISAGLGEMIGGAAAMLSGGAMAAGAAKGVGEADKTAIQAHQQAGKVGQDAARQSMKDSLKNGIGNGSGNGDDSNFRNIAKSQAREAGQNAKNAHISKGMENAKKAFKDNMGKSARQGSKLSGNLSRATSGGSTSGASVNTNSPQH